MTTRQPDPARAARQWLDTGRLLGVPFAPLSRAGDPVIEDAPVTPVTPPATAEPKPPAPSPSSTRSTAPVAAEPPLVETMPAGRGDSTAHATLDALAARYAADIAPGVTEYEWTNPVFGEGAADARLMIIGEGPGADEDRTGRPFVGKAGRKLEEMLAAMGLGREQVYIANTVKIRPPRNRTPLAGEIDRDAPWLRAQIRLVAPEAILALGAPAAQWLTGSEDGIGRLRGVWSTYRDDGAGIEATAMSAGDPLEVPVLPTYHPAYVLRQYTREVRERVWHDLQMVMAQLGLQRPGAGS